ncbi:MAG TPA: ATP-binding protein [Methylophilaceae bacterium]|nr:ATP-binding protein [Methylophilaceae bacterium]
MKSIRNTLLIWLSAGLSLAIVIVGGLLYLQAREQANQLFDYQMKQMAAAVPSEFFGYVVSGHAEDFLPQEDVIIQIWDNTGLRLYYSHDDTELPQRAVLGFSNMRTVRNDWRVYSMQHGNTVIQIAQPTSARREVAAQFAIKTVLPLLLLIPFLAALIGITVRRGLSPVRRVAAEVQSRDAASLAPVSGSGLPQEILPLTDALNGLLARLDSAIDAQRTFVADAAHELRTPLTALRLQMQLAERASDEAERKAAFTDLKTGLDRAARLVQQLLTLARQEPAAYEHTLRPLDLNALAQNTVANFTLAADSKHIDLGIQQAAGGIACINGDSDAIAILLSNLLDNAIRYSPTGSRIDVAVQADVDSVALSVEDSGPGIAPDELSRVFDRFYRGSDTNTHGSGLGLAIVKRIADLHQARVETRNSARGLCVAVIFPRLATTGEAQAAISAPPKS